MDFWLEGLALSSYCPILMLRMVKLRVYFSGYKTFSADEQESKLVAYLNSMPGRWIENLSIFEISTINSFNFTLCKHCSNEIHLKKASGSKLIRCIIKAN